MIEIPARYPLISARDIFKTGRKAYKMGDREKVVTTGSLLAEPGELTGLHSILFIHFYGATEPEESVVGAWGTVSYRQGMQGLQ